MESLCSYEKGTKNFIGRTYNADINCHLDFNEKLLYPIRKAKRRLPRRVFFEGNHEQRIKRVLQVQPELENTIGTKDLRLGDYYDEVIEYSGTTPGTYTIDGITYAHYFIAGVSGKPSSGTNPASIGLLKSHRSITQGHSHLFDFSTKPTIDGQRINSLVTGCFVDYELDWAGEMNKLWWRGVFLKRNVSEGQYDLETISMDRLKKEYGNTSITPILGSSGSKWN